MQWEKKSFDVGLNGDDSLTRLEPGEYFNAFNFRAGTSERGRVSGLQAVPGTTQLFNLLPAGTNYCIGGCDDEGRNRLVWFNWNSGSQHGVYAWDFTAQAGYQVCMSSQVTGGLNFDRFHYIHSCFIANGCIYWTDNLNPLRRINIDAGIEMNMQGAINGYIPNTAYLPVNNIDPLNGTFKDTSFLVFTFQIPAAPVPSYGSGLISYKLFFKGSNGNQPAPIQVYMYWGPGEYPDKTPSQVFADGVVGPLSALGGIGNWDVYATATTMTIYIKKTWDFGTGSGSFAPTASLNILVNNYVRADGSTPNPYVSPLNPSVISWARRPPGLPPAQQKLLDATAPGNFIGDQAFQFAWRNVFREYENSTLSPLSTTAGYNEQDPPPTETDIYLPPNSLVTRGYLATNIMLPPANAASPAYGPGVYAKLTRVGSGSGPYAAATDIPIPLDWTGYPATKTYNRVIAEGLSRYFAALPGSDNNGALTNGNPPQSVGNTNSKWYISSRDGIHPTLNIKQTWDWGLGDSTFPPTTSCNLTLYTITKATSRQYNRIDITLPLQEQVSQDVIQVDLVAAYLNSGAYMIIKSWKKAIWQDNLAIANHNLGIAPLKYSFYNSQVGIALDGAYSVKPSDSVPIRAQTVDIGKNRSFVGGYVLGYDSAGLQTSLAITPVVTTVGNSLGSTVQGEWFSIQYVKFTPESGTSYIIQTAQPAAGEPPGAATYYYTVAGATPPLPISVASGLIPLGTTMTQVLNYFHAGFLASIVDTGVPVAVLPQVPSADFGVQAKVLKANSFYQVSINFYNNYQQKGGIVTNDSLRITIPNTGFSANQYVTALNWTLNNLNALAEIPAEAYYYSINITKCLRTRFFVQAIGFVSYCNVDNAGVFSFTNYLYDPNFRGVAIDVRYLISNGMGYTLNVGDVCSFFLAGTYYALAIIGQSGNYVICELQNVGTVGSNALVQYEIYTPYKQQANEPSYEVGQLYPIFNPGTAGRQYSVVNGSIAGDVYIFKRRNGGKVYYAEAMSPNNKFYLQWITDAGRPNFTDYIGQVKKTQSVCFGNTFIQGSQVNGLSTFDALNTVDLSQEFGNLQRLMLTSKIQKEGTVMLAICRRETVSLYLGETQVAAPQGNAFLATSSNVIGTIYPLKGSRGTINPESCVRLNGEVFWLDVYNGGPVQYSENGLELITKKMRTFWRKFCDTYKSLTQAQIAALGSQPFIVGGADKFNGEVIWTIPQVLANSPAGNLPGYTANAPANLFDPFDGMAKTMVYKVEKTRWMPACSYAGDGFITFGDQLFGFKNGALWRHNDTTAPANTFYGVPYPAMVMFAPNAFSNSPKQFLNANVESDIQPGWMIVFTDYPNTQITDIEGQEWKNREGVYYKSLYRDRLSPLYADVNVALISGDKITSKAPMIQLTFGLNGAGGAITTSYFQLKYVNIGYKLSPGHKTQIEK